MPVSEAEVLTWCERLIEPATKIPPFEQCLETIPTLAELADLPAGTRVLVRGDLDVVVDEDGRVGNDARLRSLVPTLTEGGRRGWVQLVYGHRGRDPELSLRAVSEHLGELLPADARGDRAVAFIDDWLDDETGEVTESAARQLASLADGSVAVLENTRRDSLERVLWNAGPEDLDDLVPRLTCYVNSIAERLARVHVNEALAASNRDLSSTLVPLAADRVALGHTIHRELSTHLARTRQAELVVFSGIKINKLDDLEQIIARGTVRMVIAAGGLALALKRADALRDGSEFELGLAGDPAHGKIFIPPERIEQSRRMLDAGRDAGVEFVLPVDFVLGDHSVSGSIPDNQAQFDVGPQTIDLQAQAVDRFLEFHRRRQADGAGPAVAFHNGVFGKFEEDPFGEGTRAFIGQLKRMHDTGVAVYVGGGEGSTALLRYGQESWVTHCFTAGGTILKALGNEAIPYLKALWMKGEQVDG